MRTKQKGAVHAEKKMKKSQFGVFQFFGLYFLVLIAVKDTSYIYNVDLQEFLQVTLTGRKIIISGIK